MVSTPNFTDGTWNVVSTDNIAGDPNGDILWQNVADQSLILWQQDGTTTTATTDLPSINNYEAVVVGDFDGDGEGDVWLRSGGDNKILLSSTGTIANTSGASGGYKARTAEDVNGDGKDDMFFVNSANGDFSIWSMNGSTVASVTSFSSGYATDDVLLDVYDGTGDIDSFKALWSDTSGSDYELVTYTNGVATVNDSFTVDAGNEYVNSGDYDGDGNTDFLFRDNSGTDEGSVSVVFTNSSNTEAGRFEYGNNGSSLISQVNFETGGDFDNDGSYELLRVDETTGEKTTYNVQGGTASGNHLIGGDQSDAIDGEDGDDRIFGEDGDDLLVGDSGDDLILGGDGNDIIDGENDNDRLFGGAGDDEIVTGSGEDYAHGGDGDDRVISESSGNNTEGGAGNDYMYSSSSAQQRGGAGDDVIESASGRGIQEGGEGDDQLFGSASPDFMFGGSGDDYLEGGNSVDTLWGGAGDDVLIGGDKDGTATTNDYFYGGGGKDFFVLGTSSVGYYDNGGYATIYDYVAANDLTSGDHLVLEGTSSKYTYNDTGSTIEIRVTATNNLVAQIETTQSASEIADSAIYLG